METPQAAGYINVETYSPEDILAALELCTDMYADEEFMQTPHYEELMRALRHNRKQGYKHAIVATNVMNTLYNSDSTGKLP